MPISRERALARIVNLWTARVIEDPDYLLRVKLRDVATPANIDAVVADDLLRLFDPVETLFSEAVQDYHRDQELIRAWLAPKQGRAQ
jgi:hypothetical protein